MEALFKKCVPCRRPVADAVARTLLRALLAFDYASAARALVQREVRVGLYILALLARSERVSIAPPLRSGSRPSNQSARDFLKRGLCGQKMREEEDTRACEDVRTSCSGWND